MSEATHDTEANPPGTGVPPSDLTEDQLAAAPVMASIDALLIDGLDGDEDEAFAAVTSASVDA